MDPDMGLTARRFKPFKPAKNPSAELSPLYAAK
jgi:hypothetical protein